MQGMSAAYRAEQNRNHQRAFGATVLDGGAPALELKLTGGRATLDANQAIRRRATVTLTDPTGELTPAAADDLLTPYGNELQLFGGIHLPPPVGHAELKSVLVGGITDVDVDDTTDGLAISIDIKDRADSISRRRWTGPYIISAGTNVATAIRDGISNRRPGTTFNFTATTATTPQVVLGESSQNDPWADFTKLATDAGLELFFDGLGVCVLRRVPDPLNDPIAWEYFATRDGVRGNLAKAKKRLSNSETYNGVIVTGESTNNAAPARAEVWDEDPNSATYRFGDYGPIPRTYSSPLITTDEMAEACGQGMLLDSLGGTELISFSAVPHYALEDGDTTLLRRRRGKIDARYLVDTITLPFEVNALMEVGTRKRRVG